MKHNLLYMKFTLWYKLLCEKYFSILRFFEDIKGSVKFSIYTLKSCSNLRSNP